MPARKAKTDKPPPGPDDLVREAAGTYRTGDGRFEVQKSDIGWYLVDTEQANEFGQQLIHGPMATLNDIRDAVPGAREIRPLLRVKARNSAASAAARSAQKKPPPPPPSWIDRLPDGESREVRGLIRALEREGVDGAEELVRRHREDATPTIASRLVEHRLKTLVSVFDADEREVARRAVDAVVKLLTEEGTATDRPLPRWALLEVDRDEPSPKGRMRPRA